MTMPIRSLRTAAATILVAATVALLPQATAHAAGCAGSSGVSVVVDFNELNGGSLSAACVGNGGGKTAATLFDTAGYKLSPVTGEAGAICKVSGYPEDAGCVNMPPATAYWSLWWSDGKSGTWWYADAGAGNLTVPDGGYVAFAWHQGSGRATPPDVTPTPRVAPSPTPGATKSTKPKPSTKPTPKPTAKPSAAPTSATPTTSPASSSTPTPSELPSDQPSEQPTEMPTETSAVPTPTTTADVPSIDEITDGPEATAASTDGTDDGGGFPAWLGIGLVVVVLGAAGAVPVLRRRGR
ncbi:hypothetical protein [Nocardioides nitrophenolicus]|uniref:hypothetical protein n=1 Tax=Nocardioides nitrophenolicus TaxID=60489 RepID=UPI00195C9D48|nr:hypothetical protein [Nocardioides nitrophenolicus]MBM7519421.1 hypothetical protein [Nocardioides nitrophenolicus]